MEGDAPDPKACSLIGNCYIYDLPEGLPKGAPIEVTYAFRHDGPRQGFGQGTSPAARKPASKSSARAA